MAKLHITINGQTVSGAFVGLSIAGPTDPVCTTLTVGGAVFYEPFMIPSVPPGYRLERIWITDRGPRLQVPAADQYRYKEMVRLVREK